MSFFNEFKSPAMKCEVRIDFESLCFGESPFESFHLIGFVLRKHEKLSDVFGLAGIRFLFPTHARAKAFCCK